MQKLNSLFNRAGLIDKGLAGEGAFESLAVHLYGPTVEIRDVRHEPEYQRREIDFILRLGALERTYEVKSDDRIPKYNNLTFELCRIHHVSETIPAYMGWSVFSQAERLAVWCAPQSAMYVIAMRALRSGMQHYVRDTGASAFIRPVTTDDTRTTVNVFVPLTYVSHYRYDFANGLWRLRV